MGRCSECGSETDRLTPSGVCVWRAGCEHRVMQHVETMARLTAEMAAFDLEPCGHSRAEHRAMLAAHPSNPDWDPLDDFLRRLREGYGE